MMILAGIIGAFGLICMVSRRTLLGLLIGIHLLILGSSMMFVLAGLNTGLAVEGHLFGLFILLGGIAQVVVGYALAIRLFFIKKRISLDDLRMLKQ